MKIIGLTGSIGMGKSTVAAQFKQCGATVVDADALVHDLLAPQGEAFVRVAAMFPQAVENAQINRQKLGQIVFGDAEKLAQLEQVLHPLTIKKIKQIIKNAQHKRRSLILLEVPLLFETETDRLCDYSVVVSAPRFIQRQRVMKRKGMTEEKFKQILKFQMSDADKRRRADKVIFTGAGRATSLRAVKAIVRSYY